MTEDREISYTHMDVLQEVSNIGLGNAATSLAELLKKRIDISVPRATFLEMEELFPLVGDLEDPVACVNLSFDGDIAGVIMFIFTENSAYRLIDMLLEQAVGTTEGLDAMGESVIIEIGNVLSGSFMNAISDMTGLTMRATVPLFAFDMMGAILSASLVARGHWDGQVLLIETIFMQSKEQIKGHFLLLPETGAIDRLFSVLGIPAEG